MFLNIQGNELTADFTMRYLSAIGKLNTPKTSAKRPSIIQMLSVDSPKRCRLQINNPISIAQSESDDVGCDTDEYVVPDDINKGYMQCFFGFGKFLCINNRVKEGIHNLLECATWYKDSVVFFSYFITIFHYDNYTCTVCRPIVLDLIGVTTTVLISRQ